MRLWVLVIPNNLKKVEESFFKNLLLLDPNSGLNWLDCNQYPWSTSKLHHKSMITMNSSEFKVKGEDLLNKVRELINEGNVNRIIIKDATGKTYLEIPVTLGLLGALIAPILAAVGALAALAADFTIEVIRKD